ncbi:MAG: hypothetical protein LBE78_03805 [Burkholderiaceae bacterium]|jgi:hypothetical protein|nr:hypothetical protein [Burkholderiaceae bacterium]
MTTVAATSAAPPKAAPAFDDRQEPLAPQQIDPAFLPAGAQPFLPPPAASSTPEAEARAQAGFDIAASRIRSLPEPSLMGQVLADAGINARNAINRQDIPPALATEVKDTLVNLGNRLADGQAMPVLKGDFRDHLYRLVSEPATSESFKDALTQLQGAATAAASAAQGRAEPDHLLPTWDEARTQVPAMLADGAASFAKMLDNAFTGTFETSMNGIARLMGLRGTPYPSAEGYQAGYMAGTRDIGAEQTTGLYAGANPLGGNEVFPQGSFAPERVTDPQATAQPGYQNGYAAAQATAIAVGAAGGVATGRLASTAAERLERAATATAAEIDAARLTNNFYRDGGIADPSRAISATGPWKSAAELSATDANALIERSLPANAKVVGRLSADGENAKAVAGDWKPPYIHGSDIIELETTQSTRFVRVHGGRSKQAGTWIMRAEDVAGLTPQQMASKFSLPQVPTEITDVTLPAGIRLDASVANGISPGAAKGVFTGDNGGGGGVQFQIQMPDSQRVPNDWFSNSRALP